MLTKKNILIFIIILGVAFAIVFSLKVENMPLYAGNSNTNEKEIISYVSVLKQASVEEKLSEISVKLSQNNFCELPIDLIRIDNIDGKKIAIISLRESDENKGVNDPEKIKGKTWKMHYFQGSTGGAQTSLSLIETFLQREYSGEWIDGVQFIYFDEPDRQWDHVNTIFNINYR